MIPSTLPSRFALSATVLFAAVSVACSQTTTRVSVSDAEAQGDGASGAIDELMDLGGAISNDGRYVVFYSLANNFAGSDTSGTRDVFLRDRTAGTTTTVSPIANGGWHGCGRWQPCSPGATTASFVDVLSFFKLGIGFFLDMPFALGVRG